MKPLRFFPPDHYGRETNPWLRIAAPPLMKFWKHRDGWRALFLCTGSVATGLIAFAGICGAPGGREMAGVMILVTTVFFLLISGLFPLYGTHIRRRLERHPTAAEMLQTPMDESYARAAVWIAIRRMAICTGIFQLPILLVSLTLIFATRQSQERVDAVVMAQVFVATLFMGLNYVLGQYIRGSLFAFATRSVGLHFGIILFIWTSVVSTVQMLMVIRVVQQMHDGNGALMLLLLAVFIPLRWFNIRMIWTRPNLLLMMLPVTVGQKRPWFSAYRESAEEGASERLPASATLPSSETSQRAPAG